MTDNPVISVSQDAGASLSEAAGVIESGGVIGYPTETVYGLGADSGNRHALRRIFALKQRPENKPFPLLISSAVAASAWVQEIPELAERLMAAFWPGPLTLVFQGSDALNALVPWEETRVGLRVSPDPVCRALTERLRRPLVSTSANPAGRPPATTASEVDAYFAGELDLILDDGPRNRQTVSTLLDITVNPPRLLRTGAIAKEQIETIIGDIDEP